MMPHRKDTLYPSIATSSLPPFAYRGLMRAKTYKGAGLVGVPAVVGVL
ncbi:MAG: hypothetical protein ABSF69_03000 [Polyangiaceae bacterium]|jgi:hypothetical protein